jgi:hypothetical protein
MEALYLVDPGERMVLFAPTMVLLDNQASQSIVHNSALLHAVRNIEPYSLGGLKAGGEGVLVERAGNFHELDGIDGTIGISPESSANILSFPRLVNAEHHVEYSPLPDDFCRTHLRIQTSGTAR